MTKPGTASIILEVRKNDVVMTIFDPIGKRVVFARSLREESDKLTSAFNNTLWVLDKVPIIKETKENEPSL